MVYQSAVQVICSYDDVSTEILFKVCSTFSSAKLYVIRTFWSNLVGLLTTLTLAKPAWSEEIRSISVNVKV